MPKPEFVIELHRPSIKCHWDWCLLISTIILRPNVKILEANAIKPEFEVILSDVLLLVRNINSALSSPFKSHDIYLIVDTMSSL